MSPADRLQVRVQAFGTSPTTLRAKVWKVGTPEPAGLGRLGHRLHGGPAGRRLVGLVTYLSGSSTSAPVTASFGDLWAGPTP